MKRRDFLQVLSMLGLSPSLHSCFSIPETLYPATNFGNVTLLHLTDCHAQLMPVYYREPSANNDLIQPQSALFATELDTLKFFGMARGSREAYAFSSLDFAELAPVFGKMGGFAHLATLIKQIKQSNAHDNFILLDGGDTWQGSATALWTQGADMLAACNRLGVEVMTGHWEFTYGSTQFLSNLKKFNGDFVAQNISLSEEAQFLTGEESNHLFKPYIIKAFKAARVAIIGQAYPYTPIANPKRLIPEWEFGIQEKRLQLTVDHIKQHERADVVVLLSHNGLAIDEKLAAQVTGIDVILGGHTHDALPKPKWVKNSKGRTCVSNAGSHGKFLAVVDLDIQQNRLRDLRYRLLPVFSNLIEQDAEMEKLITGIREPYREILATPVAVADKLLYRRDTYQGSFDQLLLDALININDTEIAFSPGFRWGTTLLPGQVITYEDIMNHTAITYPNTLRHQLTGYEIKALLEDVADNVFNPDPYYQQGGDMVRLGGLTYHCNPDHEMGQRISQIRLKNGSLLVPSKNYTVSSWATVSQLAEGKPMADILVAYLKQ